MECPTCKAPYQPGDRFCGNCGERLGDLAPPPAPAQRAQPAPAMGQAPAAALPERGGRDPFAAASPAAAGAPAPAAAGPGARSFSCPTCGSPLTPPQTKCSVCGMEFGIQGGPAAGSAPAGSGQAAGGGGHGAVGGFGQRPGGGGAGAPPVGDPFNAPRPPAPPAGGRTGDTIQNMPAGRPAAPRPDTRGGNPICPIHGEMDATWTRCPQCIKEGREGRLSTPSGGVPRYPTEPAGRLPSAGEPSAVAAPPTAHAPAGPPVPPTPQEAPARNDAAPPPQAAAPYVPPQPPPQPQPVQPAAPSMGQAPPSPGEPPMSSVGRTVVIRRRPRALAFLIEKEGEQVGRVFQLEEDVTDIGRDPRNHVAVSDVLVSAFHARVERAPDGGFIVRDRGSTNGTRVNGQVLTEPREVDENDEVGIGNTSLVLKVVK